MIDLASVHRTQYQPSGKVHTVPFLLGLIILIASSCISGAGLWLLYRVTAALQFVPGLIALLLVSSAISVLVGKAIEFSHCRNPKLGASVGVLCGTLALLSSYHAAEVARRCQAGGVLSEEILRVDRLPSIIGKRLYAPTANQSSDDYSQFNLMQTIGVLAEYVILVGFSFKSGKDVGSRAYDEASGRWFRRTVVRAVAGADEKIVDALKTDSDLADALRLITLCSDEPRPAEPKFLSIRFRKNEPAGSAWMVLEYLIDQASNELQDAFLTVVAIGPNGKKTLLISQMRLRTSEFEAASILFHAMPG